MNRPTDEPGMDDRLGDEELAVLILALLISVATDLSYLWQCSASATTRLHGLKVEASCPLAPGQIVEFKTHGDSNYSVRCLVIWTGDSGSDREGQAGLDFLNLEQGLLHEV
jgi:hypothetical protein